MSELKRTQGELEWARDAAEQANRAKSVFLANMRRIARPLNAIIGYSQMLREDCIGPEHVEVLSDLEKIECSGQLLLGIIDDILDRVRDIPQDGGDIHVLRFNGLAARLDFRQIHGARSAGLCRPAQIPPERVEPSEQCPKIHRERTRLGGGNRLFEKDREWTEVHVSDTGIGIGREHLGKLFQPFSQVDGSSIRKYNGTGLGLAISKKFCQMMGGDITVVSELGRGSRFSIGCPRARKKTWRIADTGLRR